MTLQELTNAIGCKAIINKDGTPVDVYQDTGDLPNIEVYPEVRLVFDSGILIIKASDFGWITFQPKIMADMSATVTAHSQLSQKG